jgi:hypothetical protein
MLLYAATQFCTLSIATAQQKIKINQKDSFALESIADKGTRLNDVIAKKIRTIGNFLFDAENDPRIQSWKRIQGPFNDFKEIYATIDTGGMTYDILVRSFRKIPGQPPEFHDNFSIRVHPDNKTQESYTEKFWDYRLNVICDIGIIGRDVLKDEKKIVYSPGFATDSDLKPKESREIVQSEYQRVVNILWNFCNAKSSK